MKTATIKKDDDAIDNSNGNDIKNNDINNNHENGNETRMNYPIISYLYLTDPDGFLYSNTIISNIFMNWTNEKNISLLQSICYFNVN